MNCTECKELLVVYFEGLLEDVQERAVEEHLKHCEACRAELKELQTLRQRLVHGARATAETDLEDRVMNRILQEQNERLRLAEQAGTGLRFRRLIMKSPLTRIAAAVVVVGCAIGVMLLAGTESVALADVLARIEQIHAFAYRTSMTIEDPRTGTTKMDGGVLVSNEHGMRIDQTNVNLHEGQETQTRLVTYMLPREKIVAVVNHAEKKYARMSLDDAMLEIAKTQNRDPRQMLKALLSCDYKDLGTSVIDGRRVQGFETRDPKYLGDTRENVHVTLWVDVETRLPVRSETEMQIGEGIQFVAVDTDYQWNVPVDAAEFKPDIPNDFTADPMDGTQMPSFSEEGFIEALQMAVEFTGRYPKTIDNEGLRQLSMDIGNAITTSDSPAAQQWREQIKSAGSKENALRAGQERMMKLMALTMFNMILGSQQRDPVYHGDVVTPTDVELPLMRWKSSDSEYRVLFGDLRAETVDAETLAKLEAALPK
ncbi:MAG TPA: zf-HC2 domain-containing protein [Sedimentisphaerales bacterium]|nr:zf-HC2 domain-containing protein [Sedimentisphaerales bacterium]